MSTHANEKDRLLEDSLTLLKNMFRELNFELVEERILHPLPGIWSIHLQDMASSLFSNGKGSSKLAAQVSAYAEFAERLFSAYYFADYPASPGEKLHAIDEVLVRKDSFDKDLILTRELRDLYDPNNELSYDDFVDLSSPDRKLIHLLPMRNLAGKQVLFPLAFIKELYASNGLSWGNTSSEAKIQALCEIFERYVRFQLIAHGYSLPPIPDTLLSEESKEIQEKFLNLNHTLLIKDASLGGDFPVVCAALVDKANGKTLLSFGSHPDMEVAVSRTLTELLQGRELNKLDDMQLPSFDSAACADATNLESHFVNSTGLVPASFFASKTSFEFHNWSRKTVSAASREQEWAHLLSFLGDRELYIWEQSVQEFTVCRLIAPGFSEIYPVEDLQCNSRSDRRRLRELLTSNESCWKQYDELPFQAYENLSELCAVQFSGLWNTLHFGELLVLKALEAGEKEAALETLRYLDHCTLSRSSEQNALFFVIQSLLEDAKSDLGSFYNLLPTLIIKSAKELVNSRRWPEGLLPSLGEYFSNVKSLQKIRDAKKKAFQLFVDFA